ncbi:RidA family protein [Enterobacteriaceae bacterium H11S18]|uniref:RidA family protein n=1 Tax=Dryocola clanedunensis TaxID=2925396 RepID=UPI0022F0804A|nr:RidA family protein [Dryocola clanedunensis]MCT4708843.1 RidA family protein [Dryocola clanedunensis]
MAVKRIDSSPRMSQASQHGNLVILSGQVSEGQSVAEQARNLFASIDELLLKTGTTKSNIIYANIFLTDMNDYDAFNSEWDGWIDMEHQQSPSRSAIQVVRLAKPEWRVEVQVIVGL